MASATKTAGKLGLIPATALVIGNLIGSGIFLLPASLAPFGGLALVGWIFTSAGAILLALVFAKLAQLAPKVGGPYIYSRLAFGDFAGFIIAWGYWIGMWTSVAAVAVAMVSYLAGLIPALGTNPLLAGSIAIGTIWLLTWVNARGVSAAGLMQTITTVLKLIPLVAIGTIGLLWADWSNFAPVVPPGYPNTLSAILGAASLTLFAFLGVESATIPAGDVADPGVTIPRATIIGTLVTAVVYILSTIGVMGALPPAALASSSAPFADAAAAMWGPWAYPVVVAGAVISCFGAINGFILLQGQLPMAAAQDKLFPARFARVSPRGVPVFGLVVAAILISILLGMNYAGQLTGGQSMIDIYNGIILLATLSTLVPYAFCAMAEIILLLQDRGAFSARRFWGSTTIASLAFAFSLLLIVGSGAETVMWGFLLLLLGIPVYVWLRKQQLAAAPVTQSTPQTVE